VISKIDISLFSKLWKSEVGKTPSSDKSVGSDMFLVIDVVRGQGTGNLCNHMVAPLNQ
jgi:hypothetical protein